MTTMKALTLWQPWASLIALGEKRIETRCWQTSYRGELAIHAAAKLPPRWLGASMHGNEFRNELADILNVRWDYIDAAIRNLPYGAIVAIVRLVSIEETDRVRDVLCERELLFGNYEEGRYAWHLALVKRFDVPIPAKGNRLLWNWKVTF
jgi:activating signal cointegrator 1